MKHENKGTVITVENPNQTADEKMICLFGVSCQEFAKQLWLKYNTVEKAS